MLIRWIYAAIAVFSLILGVQIVEGQFKPTRVLEPTQDLQQLPLELGEWKGEQYEIDARIARSLGAHSWIDRRYKRETKLPVALHLAVFVTQEGRTPHLPTICYPAAGWTISETKVVSLESADSPPPQRALMFTAERKGEKNRILYFYQRGLNYFFDGYGARGAHQVLWGQKAWPPLWKVLLQTPLDDKELADERLLELAQLLLAWKQ